MKSVSKSACLAFLIVATALAQPKEPVLTQLEVGMSGAEVRRLLGDPMMQISSKRGTAPTLSPPSGLYRDVYILSTTSNTYKLGFEYVADRSTSRLNPGAAVIDIRLELDRGVPTNDKARLNTLLADLPPICPRGSTCTTRTIAVVSAVETKASTPDSA